MDATQTLPPIPPLNPTRRLQIGGLTDSNLLGYDDIIRQNESKYYSVSMELPIERFVNLQVPDSYTRPLKEILGTLNPTGLITSKTGLLLVDAIKDMVVGGHFRVELRNPSDEMTENLTARMKNYINKAIFTAELYGTAAMVEGKKGVSLLTPSEFWYDEWENIFYSVTPGICLNEDGHFYEKRFVNDEGKVESVVYFESGSSGKIKRKRNAKNQTYMYSNTIVYEGFGIDSDPDTPEYLGVKLFTHNPYNTDWVGVSTLDPVLRDLRALEMSIHEYNKALYFTKPRAMIYNDAVDYNPDTGEPNLDLTQDVYVTVDALAFEENTKMVETFQFKFDADSFDKKINHDLMLILSKIGLDNRILSFSSQGTIEKTATQVNVEDSRVYALVEGRREEYQPQIVLAVSLFTKQSVADVKIDFIPLHHLNMASMVQQVTTMKQSGLISDEQALRLIYPRWSDTQIQEELDKIQNSDTVNFVAGEELNERRKQQKLNSEYGATFGGESGPSLYGEADKNDNSGGGNNSGEASGGNNAGGGNDR